MVPDHLLGWIVIGLLAGFLSGLVVPGNQARGCLANLLVGVLGAIVGGYLARELNFGDPSGFLGSVVLAFVGAVVVRVVIGFIAPPAER
jgi:uncharacterized membrane protein YeaQ/YmgE (transglycosylase-associated protein family)